MDLGRHIYRHHTSHLLFLLAALVHQHSVLHLEYLWVKHGTCYQNLFCITSCLCLLQYTSLSYPTDHFSPNFVLCLFFGNLDHTSLGVLYFIHSVCKLDHSIIYLIELCLLVLR